MTKLSFVFITSLAVAGFACKKGGGGGDCAAALDHSMELAKADMQKMAGGDDKMLQKMKDIGLQHCKDDKWSDEVLKCMTDAKSKGEAQACYGKLTPDQQTKMNTAAMDAMKSAGGAAPAGGDTGGGSAPAGGGSAPAGSAEPPK